MVDITPQYIFHNIIDLRMYSNVKINKISFEEWNCYETNTLEIVFMSRIEILKNKMFHSQISTSVFNFTVLEYSVQWWTGLYSSEDDLQHEFKIFKKGFETQNPKWN